MEFIIRKATEKDFPNILGLIKELAAFENASDKVSNTVEQMIEEKDFFECFVVENTSQEIIAMALYYFTYFTWVGKSLYLDDLYVKEEYRGNKIATKLLEKVFKLAKENNCKRIRWQVLDWNKNAIAFYKKLGATIDKEWYNCDFSKQEIQLF